MIFSGWTFNDWVRVDGKTYNPIHEWLNGLPLEDKQGINVRLYKMKVLQRWPDTWASTYQGYSGIFELRINLNDTPYRPLGCYGPGPKHWQFTILVGAIEIEGKIHRHLLKTAVDRKKNLHAGCVNEHNYE